MDYDRNLREGKTRLTVDIRLTNRPALELLIAELDNAPASAVSESCDRDNAIHQAGLR